MTRFQATKESEAVIDAPRADVWAALTDPKLLARLTPLLRDIEADGDVWTWHMMRISALGVSISPRFTEQMRFENGHLIEYSHQPPDGVTEWAGAEGRYELTDVEGGTKLHIRLGLCVDLPLPKATGPAVRRVMLTTMNRTGDRFSDNLLQHLGAHEVAGSRR
jgi:carbon monoxide dehydrogenase subunit G